LNREGAPVISGRLGHNIESPIGSADLLAYLPVEQIRPRRTALGQALDPALGGSHGEAFIVH
jgi:hypothetical protein